MRFASDSVAADLRQRFPGLIPARPIVPMSSATDCGPVKTIYLPASAYSLNGPASFRWLPHDIA
ncbi:MAG TPA: hypothetical protein VFO87_07890, partial [Nitrospira sp.]|nr:hypothetical protein [Nitrospira sp.]